jgi:type II secretory pathway pseudopilin PulG
MSNANTKRITAAEILIVFLVLGTLAAISMPRLSHSATLDRQAACNANLELLNSAIDLYSSEKGRFPTNLSEITSNKDYFPVGMPQCPLGGTYIIKSDHTAACTHY